MSDRSTRRRGRVHLFPVLSAVGLGLVLGCDSRPAQPNIVLVTVDTLRADRLSPYGYQQIETPAIARLAREGILFERAFADASWTLPSLSSVMTGKYPTRHQVRSWNDRLHDEHRTLAEILKERGYTTAAIVGSYPLDRYFGLSQGFDFYDDTMTMALFEKSEEKSEDQPDVAPRIERLDPENTSPDERRVWQMKRELHNAYRTDAEVADMAIEWLAENRTVPFFLWVHFFGPHEKGKREAADLEEQKKLVEAQIARYDGDIEEMDRQVGRFLDALRNDSRFADTAVIFHSDHGQSLKEHGMFGHGFDLYDTTVHIPLIIRLPNDKRAGQRVPGVVRNLDIFATALDLARADADLWDSKPLLGSRPDTDSYAYMETDHAMALSSREIEVDGEKRRVGTRLRGIRTNQHKLIVHQPGLAPGDRGKDPLPEDFVAERTNLYLFDVGDDAGEHRNLKEQKPEKAAALRGLLDRHRDESGRGADATDLDEAAKERLRSLGYLP